ncbi:hypothetical protein, partial [Massilia polaris]|uniref:hypothetical protein n=1 Tax=Massilia polaris TaxID=2728846 RepID=UPI001981D2CE
LCADDSAATSVKVGYRQASYKRKTPISLSALKIALGAGGGFFSSKDLYPMMLVGESKLIRPSPPAIRQHLKIFTPVRIA